MVFMATGRVYSLGYEGWKLNSLVENLVQNRVAVLFDVRMTPSSRRPGFSRRSLEEALTAAGITYVHEPALGNPPENRAAFGSEETLDAGRRRMKRRLRNGTAPALRRLAEMASTSRVAVLCVERSAAYCHRQVITEALVELDPSIDVIEVR
jgi:uncharacterized protein (DUF488 family)